MLNKLLEDIEQKIDLTRIDKSIERFKTVLSWEKADRPPVVIMFGSDEHKPYSITEIHEDMSKMMWNELLRSTPAFDSDCDCIPMLRANYGVGLFPSLFGANSIILNNNMPWVENFDSVDKIKKVVDSGIPDLNSGYGAKVIETYHFFKEKLAPYEKCNKGIKMYHPDLQGPFDVAHLLWGSDIYYAMYDEPELVHALMSLIADTYIKFMEKIKTVIDDENDNFNFHWQSLYPGKVTLRDDSAVNLSLDAYQEFVKPYNQKIYKHFGTASMHFCGRADQWMYDLLAENEIKGHNFGRMEKYQFGPVLLEQVYDKFKETKTAMCGFGITNDEAEHFNFKNYNTGISFNMSAQNKQEAAEVFAKITG